MLKELIVVPVRTMLTQAGAFVSALCAVILILLVGWIVAKMVKNMVLRILDILQLDSTSERVGVDKVLSKGGIKYSISELIAVLCYWLVMLIGLVIAISVVNVKPGMLDAIVLYIPRVISAVVVLVLSLFFASFVNSAVLTTAANAGVEQANLLGKISQWVIVIFGIIIALEQLQIGTQTINLAITVVLASLGLACALAFGLGCKDIAGKTTQDIVDKLKSKK